MSYSRASGFSISKKLREDCIALLFSFDEFANPGRLKSFTSVKELELVHRCIPDSADLERNTFFTCLVKTCQQDSGSEPIIFDLLTELSKTYRDDARAKDCHELKERLRGELLTSGDQEEEARNFQRQVKSSISSDRAAEDGLAETWIKEVENDPDELALRITLAVFGGTAFEMIEGAKNNLAELLTPLLLTPLFSAEDPPPVIKYVPLMRRLKIAGARETEGEPPTWKRAIALERANFGSEVIRYVWQEYRDTEWRDRLIQWLTNYVVGQSADIRMRAAVAVGILAIQDYRYVVDHMLKHWIRVSGDESTSSKEASEYRIAIGMVLGAVASEERWTQEVQNLVWEWAGSSNRAFRWAAVRAYIYVGIYCHPVSDVIDAWRAIAHAESVGFVDGGETKTHGNRIHTSLMDAMARFFVNISQLPTTECREQFAGVLEGLRAWIVERDHDTTLGLYMFKTLGKLFVTPFDNNDPNRAPLLLYLMTDESCPGEYRKQLAEIFRILMNDVKTITEATDLLWMWLGWVEELEDSPRQYEKHLQNLLRDIVSTDDSGRMRGRLTACLRDCGRNRVLERVLSVL